MNKIQLLGKVLQPITDDVVKLITKPNAATDTVSEALSGKKTFINPTKLADDIVLFIGDSINKISKYKNSLPEDLYNKLENAMMNKNFKLKDIITKYYSKLDECKTLDDVVRIYPKLQLPDMTPKSNLTKMFFERIPTSKIQELQDFARNGNPEKIDEYLESLVGQQFKTIPKYEPLKALMKEIKESIIANDFKPIQTYYNQPPIGAGKGLNTVANLYDDNFDEVIIEMLKRNYINGEDATDIVVQSAKGVKVTQQLLKKQDYNLPFMNKNFRHTIDNIETTAQKIISSNIKTKDELVSTAYSNAWKAGRLKNEWRAIARHWKVLENVTAKISGKTAGSFSTERLIDAYIFGQYKCRGNKIINANPFAKYIDGKPMNELKKSGLEMLYSKALAKNMQGFQSIKDLDSYKTFKAQFDIDGMAKTIEELEQHYRNAFLKTFWKDTSRRETFSRALQTEFDAIGEKFELTDDFLERASEVMFT